MPRLGAVLFLASFIFFVVSYLWVGDSTAPNPLWFTIGGWAGMVGLAVGLFCLLAAVIPRRRP